MATSLAPDRIDDLLYMARTDDLDVIVLLQQLGQEHGLPDAEVILQAVDPDTGDTMLHMAAANGHTGPFQSWRQ